MEEKFVNEIHCLREWTLADFWDRIPENIDITAIDVCENFIALGGQSTCFWYNRSKREMKEFKLDAGKSKSEVSTIKVKSSVEFMIAVGLSDGYVNIIQIPKDIPNDLQIFHTKKTVLKYVVRNEHCSKITSCAWSPNAMHLFTGDVKGTVVQTDIDYSSGSIKSKQILDESFEIVKINTVKEKLVVSSLFRTIVCFKVPHEDWEVVQIGSKDRKQMGYFGATIYGSSNNILCSRQGLRIWVVNSRNGTVEKTLLFKEAFKMKSFWEINLLNPSKNSIIPNIEQFSHIYPYLNDYIIVNDEHTLYILNINCLQVEAIATGFRNILDIKISNGEIFILEGRRSVIILSHKPNLYSNSTFLYSNCVLEEIGDYVEPCKAEEAIDASFNKSSNYSPADIENKLSILEEIGSAEFDTFIIYSKKSKRKSDKKLKDSIVEIGCNANIL